MVDAHRKSSFLMELVEEPSFFKILINDFSIRLQIPPALTSMFGQDVPNKTIVLETYLGKSGEVKLEKLGSRFYFNNGWSDFVKANNLEQGDLLLFKYFADDPKFKVTIYGKTCCGHVGKSTCKQQTQDQKTTKFKKSRVLKYRRLLPDKNQIKFTSDNPFFQVQLKCSNVTDYLQIPPAFINMYGKDIRSKTSLEAFGKSAQVKLEKLGKRFYFSNGWSEFVKASNLEVGDFLVFKYFPYHSKFKVTVYGKTCCVKHQFNDGAGDHQRCSEPVNGKEDQRINVPEGRKRKLVDDDDDETKAIIIHSDTSRSADDDDDEPRQLLSILIPRSDDDDDDETGKLLC
ncbi:putative B3 domain-containing protein Os03g0621600 [Prosopis cineraria]|uniref:putative B3 domain-containing protein Os03g0621600 n=1 Tax=Prosopis cineraria TaxID=364024 RepID=UPI00240F503E|nr:putative B3 domain-containing protein Os03g0621600 [Prosopis cineraria]